MLHRFLALVGLIVFAPPAAAQSPAKPWTAPRNAFGQPDLEGTWLNRSATPLERPKELEGRPFLTDAEVTELKRRADRLFKYSHNDYAAGDNLFNAVLANPDHYKSPTATGTSEDMVDWEFDNRTSLIVVPPDGRIPPYTAAGQRRQAAALAAAGGRSFPAGPEDLTPSQRCISFGVPRLGGTFSSGQYAYFQIFQSPDYVMLFFETIHDARIIPLDGRPHLPEERSRLERGFTRALGGRNAGGGYNQFFAAQQFLRIGREPALVGTLHARVVRRNPLRNYDRRPHHLDQAVERDDSPQAHR